MLNGVFFTGMLLLLHQPVLDYSLLHAQGMEILHEKERKLEQERKKFLAELEILIKAARDSGFSKQEIREISITRDGKTINVWEHLEQEKLREKRDQLRRFVPRERYLSVIDITLELESQEKRKLDTLREKTVFIGAEEE